MVKFGLKEDKRMITKFIEKVLHRHKYEVYAYSPNVIRAACVWKCTKCGKLKWREDFILYPNDCHDMLILASSEKLVYVEDIKNTI